MATRHEKYFGTAERASKTRVHCYGSPERIMVEHKGRTVVDGLPARKYKSWLQEECDAPVH